MAQAEKLIFHIDVNSAFLSWTAAHRVLILGQQPDLRTIPAAVGGNSETRHGIILAKSAPAKKFGIKTGETIYQARLKCPELVIVPPEYSLYVEASRRFIALLREVAPLVEQYSIDEAWVDMTGTGKLYGSPVMAAELIKNRIRDELGFTVNVGVSVNKLLAKMAGDFGGQDQVHTLFPAELEGKLWPLPVRELFMVGPATERKLKLMGIYTIGQLAHSDPARLRLRLHKQGEVLWNFANGIYDSAVSEDVLLNKGYGNSTTTTYDVRDRATAHRVLLSLCETVAARMRQDKQAGSCVSVSIRSSEFANASRQAQLEQATDATLEIYRAACRVFDQLWDGSTPLRQLGVYMSHMEPQGGRQATLFAVDNYEKLAKSDRAVDKIRSRFGENAIMRASFLQAEQAPMSGGIDRERRNGLTKPLEAAEEWDENDWRKK